MILYARILLKKQRNCAVLVTSKFEVKKKKMLAEAMEDVRLTAENEILRLMKSMVDKIVVEMVDKLNNLRKLDSSFVFC